MAAPQGLGLYLRALLARRHGSPKQLAKRLHDHRISWVAIGGPWHDSPKKGDRWINSPERIERYAVELENVGVEVHIWGYPWHDRVDQFVDDMVACTSTDVISGWLLDPELGFKKHPAEARTLFHKSRQALLEINPYNLLGMTSYGIPAGHKSFPFDQFADDRSQGNPFVEVDYGSPQLYYLPERRVADGLEQWADLGFDEVAPSFGCYLFVQKDPEIPYSTRNRKAVSKTGSQLDEHLSHFVSTNVSVRSLIGWAYNFVDAAQWRVLARWSEWLDRGACALPELED